MSESPNPQPLSREEQKRELERLVMIPWTPQRDWYSVLKRFRATCVALEQELAAIDSALEEERAKPVEPPCIDRAVLIESIKAQCESWKYQADQLRATLAQCEEERIELQRQITALNKELTDLAALCRKEDPKEAS